jgi:hypothetical protein
VYADFNKVPGPRVFGSVSELPHRLANEYVFIRKIAPEQGGFVDHMLGNLLSGRNVFGLEVGASTLGVPLVSEDGATHINIRLSAPFEGDNNLWHGVEQFKGIAFRWTREQKVTWHLDHKLPKGTVRFAIPVVMSATPDHLESCSLTFAGVDKPLRYDGRDLVAEFSQQEKGRPWVTLTTPPPVSPKRLWGRPDDRELGIGVMT